MKTSPKSLGAKVVVAHTHTFQTDLWKGNDGPSAPVWLRKPNPVSLWMLFSTSSFSSMCLVCLCSLPLLPNTASLIDHIKILITESPPNFYQQRFSGLLTPRQLIIPFSPLGLYRSCNVSFSHGLPPPTLPNDGCKVCFWGMLSTFQALVLHRCISLQLAITGQLGSTYPALGMCK